MIVEYSQLIDQASAWVKDFVQNHPSPTLVYHNQEHTLDVVKTVQQIAAHYPLNERELAIVTLAAQFHDIGYFNGYKENHELRSAQLAEDFLKQHTDDNELTEAVKGCILSTKMPQSPRNLLEEIVCDADLFHLGCDDFPSKNKLMRKEAELNLDGALDKSQWRKHTIALLETHHYHTDYCQHLLNEKKAQNLANLKKKALIESLDEEKKKKNEDLKRPDRGIETMFRTTSTNNQRLSDMADNKANILITVNSIILSAVISLLLRHLDDSDNLTIPTFLLLGICLTTIVIAILATRPKIPSGEFTAEEVKNKSVNLLFFGNFYKMPFDKYTAGMQQVMEDREFLYGTLTKDVYSQGVVLGRKYRLLRLAYSIFMFGLIAAILAYVVAIIMND
ncbi:Pycsar system effector family protein [Olivibacter sitiensis]|uniref:Pycsar system effector family protein n=1 Tax=Olivibacter sitiensis TaxID=376470 RepID=UPI000416244C|nr:Pycsar system effector family protein [Olivibacter sitiensis]